MRSLVIVGTGDHARVAHDTAIAAGVRVHRFVEPSDARVPPKLAGISVVRGLDNVADDETEFLVAIGMNQVRAAVYAGAIAAGGRPGSLVHPSAILLSGTNVGPGSHICAGAILGVNVTVGTNSIVNTGASLDHDTRVGDNAFVAPGSVLAGRVTVGDGAHLGLGCNVLEGRTIGAWALVAAGATVIRDVAPSVRVAGVPARVMGNSDESGGE